MTPPTAGDPVITDHHLIPSRHLSVILGALPRAADVDRARIALRPGVVAAVPVVAMLALGTAIDEPVAAVTMGVGAMLVGVAWRSGAGPVTPPLGTMSLAAVMLALSTVVGTVTGRWPGLHLVVLFGFCLLAGAASAIGRRGMVVGTQTLIAFIVFGRFPESLLGGVRLAALVLAGGAAQTLCAGLVASPLAWRHQRRLLAEAYAGLAAIARQMTVSGVASAEAFDAAEQTLATPALFGDPELAGLVTLVAEGRRIRLELLVLSTALNQPSHLTHAAQLTHAAHPSHAAESTHAAEPAPTELDGALSVLGDALERIATGLESGDATGLAASAAELKRWSDARVPLANPLVETRLSALGGQVRAAVRQTAAVAGRGGQETWLPRPQLGSRRRVAGLRTDLQRIRDGASLASPSGRHALRLALVVAGTELLTQALAIPRGYWAVVAAATVLQPSFGATFTRGAERMLGTVVGVVIATLIAVAIDPAGWGVVATIGVLAALTYTVFAASFAAGIAGVTAMIVFLLHAVSPDSVTLALDRGIDTVIGGAIGLGVFVLWPTWSTDALPRALSILLGAQRDYLQAVLGGLLSGTPPAAPVVVPLARHVRVAYADADASLVVARGEPERGGDRLSAEAAAAALAALRRVTYGIHALRLAGEGPPALHPPAAAGASALHRPAGEGPPAVHPELAPLGEGLSRALSVIGDRLAPDGSHPAPLPPLRDLYRRCATELGDGVGLALDELVDAVNSAAAALEG